jgi:hypothetical protein
MLVRSNHPTGAQALTTHPHALQLCNPDSCTQSQLLEKLACGTHARAHVQKVRTSAAFLLLERSRAR